MGRKCYEVMVRNKLIRMLNAESSTGVTDKQWPTAIQIYKYHKYFLKMTEYDHLYILM